MNPLSFTDGGFAISKGISSEVRANVISIHVIADMRCDMGPNLSKRLLLREPWQNRSMLQPFSRCTQPLSATRSSIIRSSRRIHLEES
jgi:hypothetical protein